MLENVFDSMTSIRETNPDNRLHFGMGLYVVRIIAKHHGGNAKAVNLSDKRGVKIEVTLPEFLDLRSSSKINSELNPQKV